MKKIIVNENACIGCGACVALDGEHFDFNDNGFSTAISNENIESDALQTAIDSCPTSAISIEKSEDNESNCECSCNEECNCSEDCNCEDECNCGENCHCHNEK